MHPNSLVALFSLVVLGCSCGAPTPTSTGTPSPSSAPAPSSSVATAHERPTPAPARAAARPPTAEEVSAQLRLLREARAAVRAHDTATALARFDELLRLNPRAPRALCEAGYVSHLAGREEQAATRIDLALRLFGHDALVAPALRVPLAMCLYNRGLVAEAQHDVPVASASYQRSLSLRPNATVSAHLARLEHADDEDDEADGTLAGAAVRLSEDSAFIAAPAEAALLRALAQGASGEDWDGDAVEAGVDVHARVPLDVHGRTEALLVRADDGSAMLGNTSYYLALRESTGARVVTWSIGSYDATDHGHSGGCESRGAEMDRAEGLLRIRYEVVCDESSESEIEPPSDRDDVTCYGFTDEGETSEAHLVLCDVDDEEPVCVHLVTSIEQTRAPSDTVMCQDEEGHDVALSGEDDDDDDDAPSAGGAAPGESYAYVLDLLPGRRARVTWSSAPPGTPPPGEHAWDELGAWVTDGDEISAPSFTYDGERTGEGDEGEDDFAGEETAE